MKLEPVQFRRMNLVRPRRSVPLAHSTNREKRDLDSGDNASRASAVRGIRGDKKSALRGVIDGRYHGVALGCFIEGGAAGPKETARIEIEEDGSITVYVGSTNVGQGLVTVLTQIAADALNVPMERIRVLHGSTPYLKEGFGSYHSRSTVMGGSAI